MAYAGKAIITMLGATDTINLCISVLNPRVLTGIYIDGIGKFVFPGHISYTFRGREEDMGLNSVA